MTDLHIYFLFSHSERIGNASLIRNAPPKEQKTQRFLNILNGVSLNFENLTDPKMRDRWLLWGQKVSEKLSAENSLVLSSLQFEFHRTNLIKTLQGWLLG